MRDYLSPAKKYVSRVVSHPGTLGTFVIKRKHLSFAIAASFVVVTMLGFVAVKGIMQDSTVNQDAVNKSTDSLVNTTITTDNLPEPSTPITQSTDQMNDSSSSSQTSSTPTVTVNNQSIPVPTNGTVNKTVQSSNGSADVNVSITSSSNTSSNSSTSTNLQVNTNTSSRKTEFHSQ